MEKLLNILSSQKINSNSVACIITKINIYRSHVFFFHASLKQVVLFSHSVIHALIMFKCQGQLYYTSVVISINVHIDPFLGCHFIFVTFVLKIIFKPNYFIKHMSSVEILIFASLVLDKPVNSSYNIQTTRVVYLENNQSLLFCGKNILLCPLNILISSVDFLV